MRLPGTALLLIAHGSREELANADLHYVRDQVLKQRRYGLVEVAYLELAKPAILEAADACVRQGAVEVILLPYFLSAGVHVLRDLTEAHVALSRRHPGVRFRLAAPLGQHPLLAEIVLQRAITAEAQ
ncbi:MAG TPA: CbiX/SirB N-terminal domain-containing protein [Gemmataceae bacterium]|nr:CbiX/SirB N-terminal domain-containing protein [Gemmataceae bacterium]